MTTTILRTTDAGFANTLPRARLPFPADCLGYFLFGGSNADDVRNRMVAGADLTLVGGGLVAHSAKSATISTTAGFQTPFTVTPYNCTIIYVGDVPTEDMAGVTGNQYGNSPFFSLYPLRAASGNGLSFVAGPGFQDVATGSGGGQVSPVSPGVRTKIGQQQFRAITESGGTLSYYAEEWAALKVFTATGQPTSAQPATQMLIGAGRFDTSYSRASQAAFYSRALSEAEIRQVYRQMKRDNVARGWRD